MRNFIEKSHAVIEVRGVGCGKKNWLKTLKVEIEK